MSSSNKPRPADSDPAPPTSSSPPQASTQHQPLRTASYFTYPVAHVVSGLYRRLTDPSPEPSAPRPSGQPMSSSAVFTPARRTASPFQPPPLTPLTLNGTPAGSRQLLPRSLAEEIRLLVPPRLQLLDNWRLVYSLDRDGSSLSTLYDKCRAYSHRSQRSGYVLVIKDASFPAGSPEASNGTVFGAYLSDPPHPDAHYYGTGECFLWRANSLPGTPMIQVDSNGNTNGHNEKDMKEGRGALHPDEALKLAGLPPPPSSDTTHLLGRNTTFRGEDHHDDQDTRDGKDETQDNVLRKSADMSRQREAQNAASSLRNGAGIRIADLKPRTGESRSGASTPERIRFKAFPYSGVNDYMIFCETGFLSVGGGDGHYGLWLDNSFEKGISSTCQTFGNEPLSDEGTKFDVLGVEVWGIGA